MAATGGFHLMVCETKALSVPQPRPNIPVFSGLEWEKPERRENRPEKGCEQGCDEIIWRISPQRTSSKASDIQEATPDSEKTIAGCSLHISTMSTRSNYHLPDNCLLHSVANSQISRDLCKIFQSSTHRMPIHKESWTKTMVFGFSPKLSYGYGYWILRITYS